MRFRWWRKPATPFHPCPDWRQGDADPWCCVRMAGAGPDTDEYHADDGYTVVGPGHYHLARSVPSR